MMVDKHDWMYAWVRMNAAAQILMVGLDEELRRKLGIGVAEQDLLKQLAVNEGELTLTELARRVFLSKSGMTKMIDRLEEEGLAERVRSSADRRAITARLTQKGRAAFKKSRGVVEGHIRDNFRAHLTDDEINSLSRVLGALLDGIGGSEPLTRHLAGQAHSDS